MLAALYNLARPLLFGLDPERAHELSVRALEAGIHPRPLAADDARLATTPWGLAMPNPLGLAAGYDKDARVPDALLAMGLGHVEVGTITPRPQSGNPHPRLFRLVRDRALINRLGFNNAGHAAALARMRQRQPVGVVGVNIGANMADDVTYSGTVAGAIEGTLQGIRSIALSQAYHHAPGKTVPWDVVETHAPALIRKLVKVDLPDGTLLNVNFPNCAADAVAGTEVTSQGKLDFGLSIDERTDGRGFPYFWLRFGERFGDFRAGTDIHALRENQISVTPLKLDLTDYTVQDRLMRALNEGAH